MTPISTVNPTILTIKHDIEETKLINKNLKYALKDLKELKGSDKTIQQRVITKLRKDIAEREKAVLTLERKIDGEMNPRSAEVKELKKLVKSLKSEVRKDSESQLKKMEATVEKLTGTRLFSFFRKKIPTEVKIQELRNLISDFEEFQKEHHLGFEEKETKLEKKIGHALLKVHGFPAKKNAHDFQVNNLAIFRQRHVLPKEALRMIDYVDKENPNRHEVEVAVIQEELERADRPYLESAFERLEKNKSNNAAPLRFQIHLKLKPNYLDDLKSKKLDTYEELSTLELYKYYGNPEERRRANLYLNALILVTNPHLISDMKSLAESKRLHIPASVPVPPLETMKHHLRMLDHLSENPDPQIANDAKIGFRFVEEHLYY